MLNPRSLLWVLVADGGQARILQLRRKPYEFREVATLVSDTIHQANRDLVSDGSGRAFHVQGPGSHAKQPRSVPQDNAEEQFLRGITDKLDRACALGKFEGLAVFGDARTLGRLRRQLSHQLNERLAVQRSLDLVKMPLSELEEKVRVELGWVH
jgi:protein required for attachment to host cells